MQQQRQKRNAGFFPFDFAQGQNDGVVLWNRLATCHKGWSRLE